jgi:hypothetical protein
MQNTRWYAPLTSLRRKGLTDPIGNENFVINVAGLHALEAYEKSLDASLGQMIETHAAVNNQRQHILTKLNEAKLALVEAARLGARTTGEPESLALSKCIAEVSLRAQEML